MNAVEEEVLRPFTHIITIYFVKSDSLAFKSYKTTQGLSVKCSESIQSKNKLE